MLSQEQYRFSITKPLFAAARTHRHIVAAAQTAEKTGTGLKERVQLGNSGNLAQVVGLAKSSSTMENSHMPPSGLMGY